MSDVMVKVVKEGDHGYPKGEKLPLPEKRAQELSQKGEVVYLGGPVGAHDQGESKTDTKTGAGYGPEALKSRAEAAKKQKAEAEKSSEEKPKAEAK